jgi:hypothetical protein
LPRIYGQLCVVCCGLSVVRKQRAVKALSWKAGRL